MADDMLAAMLAALNHAEKGTQAGKARTPDTNNPFQAPAHRGPRARSWRDPTGEEAIGNIKKEKER